MSLTYISLIVHFVDAQHCRKNQWGYGKMSFCTYTGLARLFVCQVLMGD